MKLACGCLISLFLCMLTFAQAPDTLWTKKYGGIDQDYGHFVQQTSDGGYIFAGETKSFGAGLNDVWLVKTNSTGDTQWTKTYGGSQDENCSCVRQTSDGGYILFAETVSFGPVYWKAWLINTDESGDTSWTKLIGQSRHYFAESGQEIAEGGYVFAGYTKASGASQEDLWLVKTDTSGNAVWTKTFGGNEGDLAMSMEQTNDGRYILAAATKSFGSGDYDCWLIRADTNGDTIWSKVYGGPDDDLIYSVQQTSDNGYILAGATKSFGHANNYHDVWLVKTDTSGNTVWTKTYGGTGSDMAESVQQTLDGGYVIGGHTDTGAWIIKTDSAGDTVWTKSLGWGAGKHIQQTDDGGYILLVYDFSIVSMADVWLVKFAPDPNELRPEGGQSVPETFILKQNYPNPFNPATNIEFYIPKTGLVCLKIYDILGQEIASLIDQPLPAGWHQVRWDASNVPSGVYFYQLTAGKFNAVKKMLLVK